MVKKKSGGGGKPPGRKKAVSSKKVSGPTRMLKEVKITAKAPKKSVSKSATTFGEVATRRIDSMKRANPALGRAIGSGSKDAGGMTRYGPEQSDAIRAGLRKKGS